MQKLTLSITQLNNYIKNIFDNEELLIGVSVYGEVTNFKISNGIAYFDIKEDGAQLSCVKFSAYETFAKNGDKVLVTGKLNYHVRLGRLSFVATKVEPYGMGELYKRYLELKAKLEAEGLFDEVSKKPIPKYSNKIGVVTSETGAVIRDIYNVTRSKNPNTDILVYPAKVQGINAEKEIIAGIEYFNAEADVDVIIVARGGGSFEDLSPFNTESLARSIFKSKIPIISAVGHETDFSISDFVADLRAPTPSVAAEIAVFDYYEEIQYLDNIKQRVLRAITNELNESKSKISNISSQLNTFIHTKLTVCEKDVDKLLLSINNSMEQYLVKKRMGLENLVSKLEKSNPLSILKSGYAKVLKEGKSIDINSIVSGDSLDIYVDGGIIEGRVENIRREKR